MRGPEANQASQADLHRQVHVHAGIPFKFNHYMHACICLACNYPQALSQCGHRHDLTSVGKLSVVNITDIRSAFVETLSERFCRNAVDGVP